jgi:hypothetical protein
LFHLLLAFYLCHTTGNAGHPLSFPPSHPAKRKKIRKRKMIGVVHNNADFTATTNQADKIDKQRQV